ncbi:hypothetical protein MRS76_20550 [Rhizobiaceae bacterium n13]|uniref:hypothetical protein n=1 Tax=Ferirhizobium litorale TaxID=2927786 RepID=UPI0024B31326|nr:hypothetical protein [Fererhizobium litorale]MDI7864333.1 hypothetical protein [Fererhizobium litorale]
MADITLWKPEPDLIIHQALGKAVEEASELAKILARCLIQGLDAKDPKTGIPNRQAVLEEMADIDAAIVWLLEVAYRPDDQLLERANRKLAGFLQWQKMLEDDREHSDRDPTLDNRWNAGLDFAMKQLCKLLGVDPQSVSWDAATETLDGDVRSVIGNILRAKLGENWGPDGREPEGYAGTVADMIGSKANG